MEVVGLLYRRILPTFRLPRSLHLARGPVGTMPGGRLNSDLSP